MTNPTHADALALVRDLQADDVMPRPAELAHLDDDELLAWFACRSSPPVASYVVDQMCVEDLRALVWHLVGLVVLARETGVGQPFDVWCSNILDSLPDTR